MCFKVMHILTKTAVRQNSCNRHSRRSVVAFEGLLSIRAFRDELFHHGGVGEGGGVAEVVEFVGGQKTIHKSLVLSFRLSGHWAPIRASVSCFPRDQKDGCPTRVSSGHPWSAFQRVGKSARKKGVPQCGLEFRYFRFAIEFEYFRRNTWATKLGSPEIKFELPNGFQRQPVSRTC